MKRSIIVLAIMMLGVSGCSTILPKPVIVTKQELVPLSIPEYMTRPCDVPAPPNKDKYLAASFSDRETMLTDYTVDILSKLSECNAKLEGIRQYTDKQEQILKQHKDPSNKK